MSISVSQESSELDFDTSDSEATGSTTSEPSFTDIGLHVTSVEKKRSEDKIRHQHKSRSREPSKESHASPPALGSEQTLANSHELLHFSIVASQFAESPLLGHSTGGGLSNSYSSPNQKNLTKGSSSSPSGGGMLPPGDETKKSPYQRKVVQRKAQKTVPPVIGGYYSAGGGGAQTPSEISLSENPVAKPVDPVPAQTKNIPNTEAQSPKANSRLSTYGGIPMAPVIFTAKSNSSPNTVVDACGKAVVKDDKDELSPSFSTPPPSAGGSSQYTTLGDVKPPSFRTQLRQERAGIVMTFVFPVDSASREGLGTGGGIPLGRVGGRQRDSAASGEDIHHDSQSPKPGDDSSSLVIVTDPSQFTSSFSPVQIPTKFVRSISTNIDLPSQDLPSQQDSSSRQSTELGGEEEDICKLRNDKAEGEKESTSQPLVKEATAAPNLSSFSPFPVVTNCSPTTVAAAVAMTSFASEDTLPHALAGPGSDAHHLSLSTTQQPIQTYQTLAFSYAKEPISSIPPMELKDRSIEGTQSSALPRKASIRRKSSMIVVMTSVTPPPPMGFAPVAYSPSKEMGGNLSPRTANLNSSGFLNHSGSQRPQSGGSTGSSFSKPTLSNSTSRAASASPRSPSDYHLNHARRSQQQFAPQQPNSPQSERPSVHKRRSSKMEGTASPVNGANRSIVASSSGVHNNSSNGASRGSDNPLTMFSVPTLTVPTLISPQPPLGPNPHSNNASSSGYLGGSYGSGRGLGGSSGHSTSGRSPAKSSTSTPRKTGSITGVSKDIIPIENPATPSLPDIKSKKVVV